MNKFNQHKDGYYILKPSIRNVIIIMTFRLVISIKILFKKFILQTSNIFSGIEIHILKFYVNFIVEIVPKLIISET